MKPGSLHSAARQAWCLMVPFLALLLVVPDSQLVLAAAASLLALLDPVPRRAPVLRSGARSLAPLVVPAAAYFGLILLQVLSGHTEFRMLEQVAIATVILTAACMPAALRLDIWPVMTGASAGALLACLLALHQSVVQGIDRAYGWLGVGPLGSGAIKFGDLAAVLAALSALLVARGRTGVERGVGVAGVLAGGVALALTRSRGPLGGLALAVLLLAIALLLQRRRARSGAGRRAGAAQVANPANAADPVNLPDPASPATEPAGRRPAWVMATVLALAIAGFAGASMSSRFADISHQLERHAQGDVQSEVGHRLLLWGIALRSVPDHPVAGSGLDRLQEDVARQKARGDIAADVQMPYRHAHNEYLCALVSMGIPGLLALGAMFIAPIVQLIRLAARAPHSPGTCTLAALIHFGAFAGFALTDCMFDRQITLLVFLFVGAWLLRAAGQEAVLLQTVWRNSGLDGAMARAEPAPLHAAGMGPTGRGPADVSPADVGRADVSPADMGPADMGPADMGPAVAAAATPRLSVAIITKNGADRIEECLRACRFADEIVVLDSGSSDSTVQLAQAWGARVYTTQDWPGFGIQKGRVLAQCRGRWVLSVDADERVSALLRWSIQEVIAREPHPDDPVGYTLQRVSRFCSQPMRYGLWRDDQVLRLVLRERARFTDDVVHERLVCDGPVGELHGPLHHDTWQTMEVATEKTMAYARLGARRLREQGRGGQLPALWHGLWTFVRGYLLNMGFMDGLNGWRLARLSARGTYWRYRLAASTPTEGQAQSRRPL